MNLTKHRLVLGVLAVAVGTSLAMSAIAGAQSVPAALTAPVQAKPAVAGTAAAAVQAAIVAREDSQMTTGSQVMSAAQLSSATGRHYFCHSASIRQSDLMHVLGYAQAGDAMDVTDIYTFHHGTTTSYWAHGVAHTQAGAIHGYTLYDAHTTFCP